MGIKSETTWVKPLWDISIRTLQRCMHETYEDCPYYEQLQYSLDTRLEILFTYLLDGDTRLAEKAIGDFHSSLVPEGLLQSRVPSDEPSIIPVFSLYWIFMLEDYYLQSGDLKLVRRFRPTIDAVLDWFDRKIEGYGLIEDYYYWQFVDWVEKWQNKDKVINASPEASYIGPISTINLIYAAALKSAAKMVTMTGRTGLSTEYEQRAADILNNIEKYCWSNERGMYKEGPEIEEYTQHAQAWAVLSGLAKGQKARTILKNCLEQEDVAQCTYVYSFYLFRALEKADLYHLTKELWEKWKDSLKYNLTTWPEDLNRQRSDCHAWGSLPLYEFPTCFLGVRPLKSGWEKIEVKPLALYLDNAEGNVVTPQGIVSVNWKKENGIFMIEGNIPSGIPFILRLPDGSTKEYSEGGNFKGVCTCK